MTPSSRDEHVGQRPTWLCRACTQPWPCPEARRGLLQEFHGFTSVLTIYMSAQMCEAIEDFAFHHDAPPPDLYQRFLGWVRSPRPDEEPSP
ncbi:hypothetical protein [Krasilnikovia sp. M28-CT-15]|uniref:hypothetical protein n=1 Tax=Krasilnikovia sp. M28-CT-15 TaxID=3373540 RepID=UPI00387687F8